jgi:hypothetical protein
MPEIRDEVVVEMLDAYCGIRNWDNETNHSPSRKESMRRAVSVLYPHVARELLNPAQADLRMGWNREWDNDECRHDKFPGDKGFRTMLRVFAARLRKALATPDPAVEAVKALLTSRISPCNAQEIVAAVREADKRGKP